MREHKLHFLAGPDRAGWAKWKLYSECTDEERKQANVRSIYEDEIVLDVDTPDKIDEIRNRLKSEGYSYSLWETGSKGYHIHLRFPQLESLTEEQRKQARKLFIRSYGCDEAKQTGLIALENRPHFKTGRKKALAETNRLEARMNNELPQDILDSVKAERKTQPVERPTVIKSIPEKIAKLIATGVKEGERNRARFIITKELYNCGLAEGEILGHILKFNSNCSPPENDNAVQMHLRYMFVHADVYLLGKATDENMVLEQGKKDEAMSLLLRPDLFELYIRELGKLIEGEEKARAVLFLCANGRLVENFEPCSYHVMTNSGSGSGKDWVNKNVVKILPENSYEYRTHISARAFNYWHNSKTEPDWTWDGKLCYLEDISNEILNSDAFKLMASSGSKSTIVVDNVAKDIIIKGKPVLFVTSATANPVHELLRRCVILTLDESVKQTENIMKRKARAAQDGKSDTIKYDSVFIEAQKLLTRRKIKVPFADMLVSYFPADHIIMRTYFQRFIDWIKASAVLYQYQRQTDEDGYLIADWQDYEVAKDTIIAVITNRYMIPLTKNQLKLIEISDGLEETFKLKDLIIKVTFMGERTARRQMDRLCDFGFFTKGEAKEEGINKPLVTYTKKALGSVTLPSKEEIMTIRQI